MSSEASTSQAATSCVSVKGQACVLYSGLLLLQAKPVSFERLRVKSISFGVLRDLWAPLVTLLVSLWAVLAGLQHISRGGPRSGPAQPPMQSMEHNLQIWLEGVRIHP